MKLIRKLFVQSGNTCAVSSDVWQHFGLLYQVKETVVVGLRKLNIAQNTRKQEAEMSLR